MISYKPLLHTLLDKGYKKTDLYHLIGASSTTVAKISKNEYLSLKIIDDICTALNCKIEDVVQHLD